MNKYLRYTLKGFGYFILFLLVIYLVIYIYVTVNKKSIITQVTSEISEKISGEVAIGNVELSFFTNFPRVSVVLEKVTVKDSMFSVHKHHFLEVDEAYIQLDITRVIMKQPPLKGLRLVNGNIYLYTDSTGYSNSYLFKSRNDPASVGASTKQNKNNQLDDIEFKDVRVIINNLQRAKLHDLMATELKASIDEDKSHLVFNLEHNVLVNNLAFNLGAGSFAKGKTIEGDYEIRYDKNLKQLQFDSINLNIGGHPFSFAGGRFDLSGSNPQFNLRIHTKGVSFPLAKALVTPKISKAISIVNLDKPVNADVLLSGPLRGSDPVINVLWSTKNAHLTTPFIDFDKASFSGSYTNEVAAGLPRKDANSKIELNNFTAEWHGFPITSSNFKILDLQHPTLDCDLKSAFPLPQLSSLMKSTTLHFDKGQGLINITYKGPVEKNNNTNSFVNGLITISNGELHYEPREVVLKNVFGRVVFKSSDVFVENLECVVLNNKIIMHGSAKDLLTYIGTSPSNAKIDWSIYSPSLNLASFSYLLRKPKTQQVKREAENQLERSAQQIDDVIEKGSLRVALKADKLYYKKFEGYNANAEISLLDDRYVLHKVRLGHAGGTMDLSGSLLHSANNYHHASLNVSMANMDVSKVFSSFNNFGQDGITAENLRGNLTSDVSVNMGLNNEGVVYKESLEGIVDFSLKKGALVNYEPLKKMQVFVLKNRNFDNITFAELKSRFEIKNEEVKIHQMEIQSSVLTMFVDGVYSMKGTTDLTIQVPLSNLKKREENFVPHNLEAGKKAGASVYLRGTPGKDGNIKFKLDVFNKLRKDKDEIK